MKVRDCSCRVQYSLMGLKQLFKVVYHSEGNNIQKYQNIAQTMRVWVQAKRVGHLSQNSALLCTVRQRDASYSSRSQGMNPLALGPTEPSVPTLDKCTLVCSPQG